MSRPAVSPNHYTDARVPHPNLFLSSLQLLGWLLFHPAAWRYYVTSLDPTLPSGFCLVEVRRAVWRTPHFRWLLVRGYGVCPCVAGLCVWLILWCLPVPGPQRILGTAYSVVVSVVVGGAVGSILSVAGGIVAGVLGGIVSGVTTGVRGGVRVGSFFSGAAGMAAGGVAGVAASVAAGVSSPSRAYSFARQLGSVGIGVMMASLVAMLVMVVLYSSARGMQAGIAAGTVAGGAVGLAVWLRSRRWRWDVAFGAVVGMLTALAYSVATSPTISGMTGGMARVTHSVMFSVMFTLPYVLTERLAGPWAGAVAGVVGGGIWLVGIFIGVPLRALPGSAEGLTLLLSTLGTLTLGLTQTGWRPIVSYLCQAAWSTLLYRLDARRTNGRSRLLGWHAAFWDEFQRLPLPFLDEHLVLVTERDPAEGQAALAYVATRHQRWAAQAAQIESMPAA
jgi:hypothetical protein